MHQLQEDGYIQGQDFIDFGRQAEQNEYLAKFLDWFLERYYKVKGATPNQASIIAQKYLDQL